MIQYSVRLVMLKPAATLQIFRLRPGAWCTAFATTYDWLSIPAHPLRCAQATASWAWPSMTCRHMPSDSDAGCIAGRRRVAEVDSSLAAELYRESARMRLKEKAATSRQKQQFRNFFGRDEPKPES